MIFQPVLHPVLLAIVALAALAAVVWALVRSRGAGARVLWSMRALLVLLCLAALLRPGIPGGQTTTLATDTDVFLVVDTTASIVAEDFGDGRQRLEGVREDIGEIVQTYPGARFALITFDADPQLRLPLTTDTSAVVSSLDVMRPEVTTQSRGSSIGNAAGLLTETLRAAAEAADGRSRMVFYFGDGEQTVTSAPESFASAADFTDGGLVLGYGTAEGGPMKITTGRGDADGEGYIQYEGADALSIIDEDNLRTIADELGITYELRSADAPADLPESPATSTDYSAAGVAGNVIELFWIPVLGMIAILGFEVARATTAIVRMRTLVPPRTRASRKVGDS